MLDLYSILISLPIIVLSSAVHEFAHAFAADQLGDLTPRTDGRLTLNPFVHISPMGLISMLVAKFGWSKPVRINEYNFQNPVLDAAITAIAGPTSNFLIALVFSAIYNLFNIYNSPWLIHTIVFEIILINLGLTIFNLLPIPPLDGSRVVRLLLPNKLRPYWESIEKHSTFIILLFLLPISPIGQFTSSLISSAMSFLLRFLIPQPFI
ncbi:site-2 protease family protein [Candidatus Dojkabacteria bacterium]|nr:site-2 protease family protein [Candidatus Dojkabacteria bacterium]